MQKNGEDCQIRLDSTYDKKRTTTTANSKIRTAKNGGPQSKTLMEKQKSKRK